MQTEYQFIRYRKDYDVYAIKPADGAIVGAFGPIAPEYASLADLPVYAYSMMSVPQIVAEADSWETWYPPVPEFVHLKGRGL